MITWPWEWKRRAITAEAGLARVQATNTYMVGQCRRAEERERSLTDLNAEMRGSLQEMIQHARNVEAERGKLQQQVAALQEQVRRMSER